MFAVFSHSLAGGNRKWAASANKQEPDYFRAGYKYEVSPINTVPCPEEHISPIRLKTCSACSPIAITSIEWMRRKGELGSRELRKIALLELPMRSCGKTINSLFINKCKIEEVNFTPKFQCIVNGFWKIASYNTVFNATQFMCFVNGKHSYSHVYLV